MPALFSDSWYRVAALRPRLRRHAKIYRHVYRGHPWYVLEDVANQRVHRFSPSTYAVVGLMDGERSVQEIWEHATDTLGDEGPTQDEVIRLFSQLHSADVLQCDVPPDTAELLDRIQRRESHQLRSRFMNPFAIRIPLLDPDRFLVRSLPVLRPLLGWFGVAIWLAAVLSALVLVGSHWSELTEGFLDRVLAPRNLVLIWLLFPVIKILHELGHGVATRYFGGEVHDMGVMLLVFTPIPYVDASSASAFPERSRRMLVAGAGMIVEVFLAALAFHLWRAAEPGVVRTLAYNTMLIGGITTLTFNANPLLRFDGYYLLSDWLEIPNLRQRANDYVGYLLERFGFGNRDALPPDAVGTEPAWLVTYSISAFVYRFFIIAFILTFVLDLSLVFGAILGAISAIGWLFLPLGKGVRALFGARLRRVRRRATLLVGGVTALLVFSIFFAPLPFRTLVEGVVWIPEEAMVRTEAEGFVARVLARPGERVRAGEPLIELRDPDLEVQVALLRARLDGLLATRRAMRVADQVRAEMVDEQINLVRRHLSRALERQEALTIFSATDGTFVMSRPEDHVGRFYRQGDLLAHVVELGLLRMRAVVPQQDIDLVRSDLEGIEVRRAERMAEVLPGRMSRLGPAASAALPSRALGSDGGGQVAVDPRDSQGTTSVAAHFPVEIEADLPPGSMTVGGRVYVRFDHGQRSLASRWYRSVRQLFLARFDV